MIAYKRYVIWTSIGSFLFVVATATINIVIDPYAIFGTPRITGLNYAKPFAGDRGRISKRHQVLRVAPRGLVIGNSRPEMGLSPEHLCWPAAVRPVYNIALPGLSVYRQVRYAQHAQSKRTVAAQVIGVDFIDFLGPRATKVNPRAWPPSDDHLATEAFAVDPNGHSSDKFDKAQIDDYIDAVLSLNALSHSLITLIRQSDSLVPTRNAAGFNPAERLYLPIILAEGVGVLFQQKNLELAKRLNDPGLKLFGTNEAWSPEFEALQRLFRQSGAAGIETIAVINPLHAELLVLLDAAGLWPQFELWKRRLVDLALTEDIALWDFSSADHYAAEMTDSLPIKGAALTWFWEPAHYRRELGDLMLANIWRSFCPPELADMPAYGIRLDQSLRDGAELNKILGAQRALLDDFKAAHPKVADRIEQLFGR